MATASIRTTVLATCLGGCALGTGVGGETELLCSADLGSPCTSMSEVDGSGGARSAVPVEERAGDTANSELSERQLVIAGSKGTTLALAPDGGAPYYVDAYRKPERLGSLWIAPHFDGDGIFHEATFVHFVLSEAEWLNRGGR